MAKYDLNLLLSGTLTDEQVEQIKNKVTETVLAIGGQIDFDSELLRRRLAYVIDKVRNGIYIKAGVEIDKERVEKLRREMKLLAEVLRFSLTVKSLRVVNRKKMFGQGEGEVEKNSFFEKNNRVDDKEEIKAEKRVSMEELDQKIDEILDEQPIN